MPPLSSTSTLANYFYSFLAPLQIEVIPTNNFSFPRTSHVIVGEIYVPISIRNKYLILSNCHKTYYNMYPEESFCWEASHNDSIKLAGEYVNKKLIEESLSDINLFPCYTHLLNADCITITSLT